MHLPTDFYLSYPYQVRAKTAASLTSPHFPQNNWQGQTLSVMARTELTGLHRSLLRCDSLHFMLGYKGGYKITLEEVLATGGMHKQGHGGSEIKLYVPIAFRMFRQPFSGDLQPK